jgi:hypothetical protein
MLARLFRQAWLWSAYWRLYPLWHLLCRAVPEIELPLDPAMRWDIRYRLHRRIIEIRDAQLILRPYAVRILVRLATAMARESGLPPDKVAAIEEAVILVSALRFRMLGPMYRECSLESHGGVPSSGNMRSEAASLIRLRRTVRHSQIVHKAAGQPPRHVSSSKPSRVCGQPRHRLSDMSSLLARHERVALIRTGVCAR